MQSTDGMVNICDRDELSLYIIKYKYCQQYDTTLDD